MSINVDIEKKLGNFLLKVKFEAGNETLALLGASGCGKSMTLKCIAGIEKPDKGKIIMDGVTLFDSEKRIHLPPQKRRTGLLFQNYALFPNMTVEQNINAGAKRAGSARKQNEVVRKMMECFEITELAKHYPNQLSGGQQQRVALARLLVSEPEILLLDEPFSALDSHLRLRLEQEVREVINAFGKTVLLVSHDRDEVFRMCDTIALMYNGKIDKIGQKEEIYRNPGTKEGMLLTGCRNISPVERTGECRVLALDWGIELELSGTAEDVRYIGIRSHEMHFGKGENTIACQVMQEMENPFSYTLMLKPEGSECRGYLLWETGKEFWRKNRRKNIEICIPSESVLSDGKQLQ